ncbi:MAG: hypothetical protein MJ215_06625 [Spirochaetia bacterium]|nr:hypothetical protein [Spirochaetia bacterium]
MADNRLSITTRKFLSATSNVLGDIFRNVDLEVAISLFGLFIATSNMVTSVLFTIFMALDAIDAWTGKFSHEKPDRWSVARTGPFLFILALWFFYFSSGDHFGFGTLDFVAPFPYKVICFVLVECVLDIIVLVCWLLKKYVWSALVKLWDYLNRWQQ